MLLSFVSNIAWLKSRIIKCIFFFALFSIFMPAVNAASLTMNGGSITLNGTYNYDSVTLTNGAIIYVTPYDGTGTTGTLILNVLNDVYIDATSSINGEGRGYAGGSGTTGGCNFPPGGKGGNGAGGGSVGSGGWCGGTPSGGGGAASYGTSGGAQVSPNGATGATYGTTTGADITMGSGGGESGYGYDSPPNPGGAGGAMLNITAGGTINMTGSLLFNGGAGGAGKSGFNFGSGGGGGASGGGVLLKAKNIKLDNSIIRLRGGAGGIKGVSGCCGGANNGQDGAAGGGGRFKVFYSGTFTNTSANVQSGTAYYESSSLTLNGVSITLNGTHYYDSVTLTNGAIIYVTPYDGTGTTGTLTFKVANKFYLDSTSTINGAGRGYRGGGNCANGEVNNPAPNTGGGKTGGSGNNYYYGGGGGGYATNGNSGGGAGGGAGGWLQGTNNGWDYQMGSSGGSGCGSTWGGGGNGGASLSINATEIVINGIVNLNGNNGYNGGQQTGNLGGGGGGGGGAAGGMIMYSLTSVNISGGRFYLNGGSGGGGGSSSGGGPTGTGGGSGSGGRLKTFYSGTLTNTGATVQAGSVYYEQIGCSPPASGDWTIPAATECVCNSAWNVPANVYVRGTLNMQNGCNINFTSSGQNIYVYSGANIYMYPLAGFNK